MLFFNLLNAPESSGFDLSNIFNATMSPLEVVVSLLIALGVGIFIFFIYKVTFAGVMY